MQRLGKSLLFNLMSKGSKTLVLMTSYGMDQEIISKTGLAYFDCRSGNHAGVGLAVDQPIYVPSRQGRI